MSSTTVFITGATGVQGSATIRALISLASNSNPITIHAFVRDPSSARAQTLTSLTSKNASANIKLFTGNFDDIPSIAAAATNTTRAFLNVTPSLDPSDANAESRHASNILTALSSVPTIHRIVYSSVNGVADPSQPGSFKGLATSEWMYMYFSSKFSIQESVRKTAQQNGWDYTFLQPATFLTNFLTPVARFMYPGLMEKKIVTAFPPGWQLTYLDPQDIGRFAARVFVAGEGEMEERWRGKKVPLGSVQMSLEEVVGVMNDILGLKGEGEIKVMHMKVEEVESAKKINPLVGSQVYQINNPHLVDVEMVRAYGIELGGVEEFFLKNREALEDAVGL